jgi:hypothetical protein
MKNFNILELNLKKEALKDLEINKKETSLDYVKNLREGEII